MDDIYAGFDMPEEHGKQPAELDEKQPRSEEAKPENKAATALDAELAQAMQSLGTVGTQLTSFWGSFRKQSTEAYTASVKQLESRTEAAKKASAPYVSKAREELNKLGEQARNSAAAGQAASVSDNPSASAELSGASQEPTVSFYGEVMSPPTASTSDDSPINAAAFFKSLSSSIQTNPNLVNLKQNISTNPNLRNLQKNLSSFQQTLQSQSSEAFKHPEEFMSKAGKLLNSAVQIVPPSADTTADKGKAREDKLQEVLGRKQGLKHQLQTNVAILLVDPLASLSPKPGNAEREGNPDWEEFEKKIAGEGGMNSEAWQQKAEEEMDESPALRKTFEALVPEKLASDVFWSRYFFRVRQIEQDEARRKQVLERAATLSEDDFSWDMEDEESVASPTQPSSQPMATSEDKAEAEQPESPSVEKTVSPRNSSEEGTESSYALVSGPPSTTSSEPETKTISALVNENAEKNAQKKSEDSKKSDDEDSDWE